MKLYRLLCLSIAFLFASCHVKTESSTFTTPSPATSTSTSINIKPSITEKWLPISDFSEERTETITHIVIHFISNAVANPQNPHDIEDAYNILKNTGVSTHFIIDREGEIFQLIPTDRVAWHAGKGKWNESKAYSNRMNHYSIGIELLGIGTKEEMSLYLHESDYNLIAEKDKGFTVVQYAALSELIKSLVAEYPTIPLDRNHIIGHDEYSASKTDPGSLFDWNRLDIWK
jgi:N-acetyl-anhydromuramyl-L-alanine amidase AmpD